MQLLDYIIGLSRGLGMSRAIYVELLNIIHSFKTRLVFDRPFAGNSDIVRKTYFTEGGFQIPK